MQTKPTPPVMKIQCPDCPDGNLWTAKGPTNDPCPTCGGNAHIWAKYESRDPDATAVEDKHPDCVDRCQILEHKGYHVCSQTGRCEQFQHDAAIDAVRRNTEILREARAELRRLAADEKAGGECE